MKRYILILLLLFVIVSTKAQFNYNKPFFSKTSYKPLTASSFFNDNELYANRVRRKMGGVQKYSLMVIGIQGGGNMCNMMGSTLLGNSFMFGYNAGFFVNIWHQEIVSLHIELNYTQFGYKNTLTTDTKLYTSDSAICTTDRYSNNLNEIYHTIQLPILARFAFGGDVKFYFDLGPYVSYSFLSREQGDVTTQTTVSSNGIQTATTPLVVPVNRKCNEFPITSLFNSDMNKFDVGATGGLGIKIYTGTNEYKFYPYIFVEARFSYGFLSVVKPYDVIVIPDNPIELPYTRKVHPMINRYSITLNAGIGMPL